MTVKEEINAFMTSAKCINSYRVEQLNCSFVPQRTYDFETMEEAEKKYEELRRGGFYPAFLRKYAVVSF